MPPTGSPSMPGGGIACIAFSVAGFAPSTGNSCGAALTSTAWPARIPRRMATSRQRASQGLRSPGPQVH